MSKFKGMHNLSESKSILTIEQKAIVSCFVKHVAFLLGHPVVMDKSSSMTRESFHLAAQVTTSVPCIMCVH